MKILVVGGFDPGDAEASSIREYARALGAEIVRQGHTLLNGCQTEFDSIVAKAAWDALDGPPAQKEQKIVSYAMAGSTPAHRFGRIIQLAAGQLGSRRR